MTQPDKRQGSPESRSLVHPTEASFVGEHDPQPTTVFCRGPFGFSYAAPRPW